MSPRPNVRAGRDAQLESRDALDALERLTKQLRDLGTAARDVGPVLGSAAAGAQGGGGFFASFAGGLGSFGRAVGGAFAGGAAQGIRESQTLEPEELAARAGFRGLREGAARAVEVGVSAVGGRALGSVAGELVRAGGQQQEDAFFTPLERANARLGALAGQVAAGGGRIDDRDLELARTVMVEQERRRYAAERKAAGMVFGSGILSDTLAAGASLTGR